MIKSPKRAVVLALIASGQLAFASVASAESVTPRTPSATTAKSVSGSGSTRFDWLAKRNSAKTKAPRISRRALLGNGSWICSPAGFNRKSRCFKR